MSENRLDPETLQEVIDTLKKFSIKHFPKEKRLEWDKRDFFPEELVRKMLSPDLGLHLLFLPEEYGGLGGGAYDIYRVSEEMAKIDLGMATAFLAISLGTDPLRVGGTPEQKKQWMTRIAEEGLIVAYGATEPGAGSDLASLKTHAEPVYEGENKIAYRLSGVKQFITNGSVADIYSILAVTPGGPSFFIVEKGTPGLGYGKKEEKHGIRLSNTSQVVLDNVLVPADQLIGIQEGQGISQAVSVFGYTRLMVAAFGLGGGEAALACAIDYGKQREQFGKALVEMQGYTHKLLIPNAIHLEAARAYIEEIASRLDAGESGLETEGAIAKLFATEAGNRAADAAIQAHGGYGYTHEYEVEKIKRDVRITTIYEGTSEIMQQTIAKSRWAKFLQTKGGFYERIAKEMDEIAQQVPGLGTHSLATSIRIFLIAMEYIREKRLTREQYILFQMADMIAFLETAAALCRKSWHLQKTPSAYSSYLKSVSQIYTAEVLAMVSQNAFFYLTAFGASHQSDVQKLHEACYPKETAGCYLGLSQAMSLAGAYLVG